MGRSGLAGHRLVLTLMSPLSLPTKAVTADSKVEIAEDSSEQLSRYRRSAATFSRTAAAAVSAMNKKGALKTKNQTRPGLFTVVRGGSDLPEALVKFV